MKKMDTKSNLRLQTQKPKVILPPRVSIRKTPVKSTQSEQAVKVPSPVVLSNIKTSKSHPKKKTPKKKKSLCVTRLFVRWFVQVPFLVFECMSISPFRISYVRQHHLY